MHIRPAGSPKVDLLLSPFGAHPQALIEAAKYGEQLEFDGLWTYDHLTGEMFGRGPSLDVFSILAAIGVVTNSVELGPLVANVLNRHPIQLALAAKTLHELTNGRAVIGLGTGSAPGTRFAREQEALGWELGTGAERRQRLAEAIALLRSVWSGADHFNGHFYAVRDFDFNLAIEDPPRIVVGASGVKTAEVALRHADGLNIANLEAFHRLKDMVASERKNDFEVSVHVSVDLQSRSSLDEQIPEPSPLVDRWVFAVQASSTIGPIAELKEAIDRRLL